MIFQMPTLVYEEEECVRNHAVEFARMGRKALIVTGSRSAKENGSLADVHAALKSCGISSVLFDQVEENPSVETVMKAREIGVEQGVDFVVGIGGGSPMDAAKAIALMIANPGKDETFLDEKVREVKSLPVICVPTTCGTGSEVTGVAVMTRHQKKTKASMAHKVYPALSLVDSKYLESAPAEVIGNTAIDALAHLVESYINSNATDYSRMFVREGLLTFRKCKGALLGERIITGADYRNLMNASTFAGMAIAHTGTSLPHALSYQITYEMGMAHGKACGYFLSGYIREASVELQDELLSILDFNSLDDFEQFISEVCQFEEISEVLLEKVTAALAENAAKLKNCPYYTDIQILRRIAGL